ncbi:MAG: hypothetical protein OEM02_09535 [Desulfobulbaceae bacterium]|nr:hypothetical protein [Desulfobulbaceae bacterium]
MGYEPIVNQNPLRVLKAGLDNTKQMGLVMARAGLGKTALLVQISLDSILRGERVIHVSIGESIEKTRSWYDDILQSIIKDSNLSKPQELIDTVKSHRVIMTFKESSFNRPKLEERLNDLIIQDIFRPNCLVLDGFDFNAASRQDLVEISELATAMDLEIWFSAVSHRDDDRVSESGVPAPCHEVEDLFDTVVLLKPEKDAIKLDILKNSGTAGNDSQGLSLDPSTMMINRD